MHLLCDSQIATLCSVLPFFSQIVLPLLSWFLKLDVENKSGSNCTCVCRRKNGIGRWGNPKIPCGLSYGQAVINWPVLLLWPWDTMGQYVYNQCNGKIWHAILKRMSLNSTWWLKPNLPVRIDSTICPAFYYLLSFIWWIQFQKQLI